ncbi:MAG TPA: hypothetical protein PKH79_14760 [Prolixibacteraceae bacterium]|nr:hypothetical protein [Prolixibacteraceae bacterium]HPS14067.1 hypothetical protein [Prolixibacteraceae bacterium]
MDAKVKAIIAHFTIVGWLIALLVNLDNKEEFTSFYLRQTLGIHIISMCVGWVPIVGWLLGIIVFVFWLISFIYAVQGDRKTVPLGEYFQDWFRSL